MMNLKSLVDFLVITVEDTTDFAGLSASGQIGSGNLLVRILPVAQPTAKSVPKAKKLRRETAETLRKAVFSAESGSLGCCCMVQTKVREYAIGYDCNLPSHFTG